METSSSSRFARGATLKMTRAVVDQVEGRYKMKSNEWSVERDGRADELK